jgi:cardiolipin synthase
MDGGYRLPVRDLLDRIDQGFSWMTGKHVETEKPFGPGQPDAPQRKTRNFKVLSILALVALILQSGLLFLALFEPGLPYRVSKSPAVKLDSERYVRTLEALTGAHLHQYSSFEVLTNGDQFYMAQLDAIRQAKRSINLEAYIFQKGQVGDTFIDAMAERASAGVRVNLIIDAIGALRLTKYEMRKLTEAGGEVQWYHPFRWNTWPRINNRTHRELLIIDGSVGFVGGAGWADHWFKGSDGDPRWRDTMVRVEGSAVTGLQSVFAENWLESSGEILTGYEYFPFKAAPARTTSIVVGSAPTTGRSTNARILFQTLLASASKSIYVTTPYFLPDRSVTSELTRAVKERGVDVKVVVPGHHNDHLMTRRSSRRLYGPLLEAGAKIYEYQPSMIHTKSLVVDGLWGVVGSTNFDSRSFGINDEVNLAVLDPEFARRLEQDFFADLAKSREITLEQWRNRPHIERAHEWFGALLQRQQ